MGLQSFNNIWWDICLTFAGDLAFGEPLNCLASSEYHPWVEMIFAGIRASTTFSQLRRYLPPWIIGAVLPKNLLRKRLDHIALTQAKVRSRLATKTDRPDFMTYILRHNDERGMNEAELFSNASLLILAGSETTATALSGTTYHLLKTPNELKRLTQELRTRFRSSADMTTSSLASCELLNAVLREGIRMYPPVPVGLPRKVLVDDAVVVGHYVPKGVSNLIRT